MPKPPLLGEVASSEAKMSERLYRAEPALFRSLERRPLSNLSDACGASSPGRGALGKEVSFSMKLIWFCWKTSRNAKASPTRGGGIERSEDDGEVFHPFPEVPETDEIPETPANSTDIVILIYPTRVCFARVSRHKFVTFCWWSAQTLGGLYWAISTRNG